MAPLGWLLSCFTPPPAAISQSNGQSQRSVGLSSLASSTPSSGKSERAASADPTAGGAEALDSAQVNEAFSKVEALVQHFSEMRSEGAVLRTLRQAVMLITEEWQGSFARIHVVSRDSALLLATAPKAAVAAAISSPRPSPTATAAAPTWPGGTTAGGTGGGTTAGGTDGGIEAGHTEALLMHLRRRGLALGLALDSSNGCYSWVRQDDGAAAAAAPVPPDYKPYVAAGAQAVFSIVLKLPARNLAVLTIGFSRNAGASKPLFLHKLWPTFLRVIASGVTLILGMSAPRYLDLALDLRESPDMGAAMSCIVRRLRDLSGQASSAQMWFRVALKHPHVPSNAVLFDVPSEIQPSLRSRRLSSTSSGQIPSARSSRLGPSGRDSATTYRGSQSGRYCRTTSTPFDSPDSSADGLRTVVGLEHTLLRAAMEGCNQVAVPDVQKLLNHGGLVAADIFSVHEIRPPASVLLLPLVEPASPSGGETCFGAVYCMSSVLTDFVDVKQQLLEAVVDILSPHLFAALSREPLASQFMESQASVIGSMLSLPADVRGSIQRRKSKLHLTTSGSPFPTLDDALGGQPGSGDVGSSVLSHRTSGSSFTGSPSSYTKALVTGLTDKINTHRMIQSMDEDQATNLRDLQLLSLLGAGGYGYVFQGRWRGILVAIKLIKPAKCEEDASRAALKHAHEIAILSSVSHPNVLQAYTFMTDVSVADVLSMCLLHIGPALRSEAAFQELLGLEDDLCHIDVLELCDQGSLMDALKRNRYICGPTVAADAQVAAATAAAAAAATGARKRALYSSASSSVDFGVAGNFGVPPQAPLQHHGGINASSVPALLRHGSSNASSVPALLRHGSSNASSVPALLRHGSSNASSVPALLRYGSSNASSVPALQRFGSSTASADSLLPAAAAVAGAGGALVPTLSGRLFPDMSTLLLTLVELASALAHLHSLGIVHCDIKPDNVLLKSSTNDARGFTVKLADFGLSRVQDNGSVAFPCNSCGTLAYVAPEALSNKKVDQSIDVYSFGVLMYELYVCKRPYPDVKREHLIHGVTFLHMRPMFPAGAHPEYVELARACWHHTPAKRPPFESIVSGLNDLLSTASHYVF